MKKRISASILAGVILLTIFVVCLIFTKPDFSIQYVNEGGELITETYHTTRDFNVRANDLKQRSITYYRVWE